jgi:glycosyltransferase involved in cell wall biosynthesis
LLAIDKKNKYILFAGTLRQKRKIEEFLKSLKNKKYKFEKKVVPFPPKIADLIWNKLHIFPIERFTGKLDLFHSSNWAQPPASCPTVTTVHDLTPLKFPQAFEKKTINSFKRSLYWVKKKTGFIIVDSNSTKKDLIKQGYKKEKIKTVYLGISDKFKPEEEREIIEKTKRKYNIEGEYILSVGTLEPRKNIKRVIKAYKSLSRETKERLKLVLVGRYGWGERVNKKDPGIVITGFVDDNDLPVLYSAATIFVYPSLYEGFGLPVVEAMACGTPVITSNTSSLPELTGNAALLVDPKNILQITKSMEKLAKDKALCQKLIKKGLMQAKKFSWKETARETLKIYKKFS